MAGAAADGTLGALDARIVDQGANLAVIEVKSSGETSPLSKPGSPRRAEVSRQPSR